MNTTKTCPNCAAPLHGSFCANCGQNQKSTNRFLLSLINEAFEDIFRIDSRAWRTTYGLLFKPGFLSSEYFAGRRARFIPPLRLYVITSLAFFVSLSVMNFFSTPAEVIINGDQTAVAQSATSENAEFAADKAPETAANGVAQQEFELDEEFELDDLSLSFLDDVQTEYYRELLKRQGNKLKQLLKEDPSEFGAILIDLAPPIIFLLLPIFALLLKFAYLFKGMFYTEHLVVAVHNQCFLYAMLLIHSILPFILGESWSAWPQFFIGVWIPVYLLLSLKRVYQQSWPFTCLKYFILSASYGVLLAGGMAIAAVVGVLTL